MIPTTSGTGSEVSDGSILSDENHIKQNFISNGAYADYCILDYDLMVGMPPKLTAATGLDALAHACESMTGTLSSPYMELVGQQVIRDIIEFLPRAVADGNDIEAVKRWQSPPTWLASSWFTATPAAVTPSRRPWAAISTFPTVQPAATLCPGSWNSTLPAHPA